MINERLSARFVKWLAGITILINAASGVAMAKYLSTQDPASKASSLVIDGGFYAMILIASVLVSIGMSMFLWRIQFLDPSALGISFLVELLTLGILALKPQIRFVAMSTIVVALVPEILRFYNFPSSILGYIRILIYAVLLIILMTKLAPNFVHNKRSI